MKETIHVIVGSDQHKQLIERLQLGKHWMKNGAPCNVLAANRTPGDMIRVELEYLS